MQGIRIGQGAVGAVHEGIYQGRKVGSALEFVCAPKASSSTIACVPGCGGPSTPAGLCTALGLHPTAWWYSCIYAMLFLLAVRNQAVPSGHVPRGPQDL